MHSDKRVQSKVREVCNEQGIGAYDGDDKDPIPNITPPSSFGHDSAEYGGVKGATYPGGGGSEKSPGTSGE